MVLPSPYLINFKGLSMDQEEHEATYPRPHLKNYELSKSSKKIYYVANFYTIMCVIQINAPSSKYVPHPCSNSAAFHKSAKPTYCGAAANLKPLIYLG